MAAKRKTDPFVRCFEVGEPRLHEKGHTIYKVTLKTIKVDAPDEDVVETVLWKRFNDFKKLYKAMFTLHKALHRAEEFPPFARAKLFGRFDEQVITERQQSAQDLLNFVGQRHYLVSTTVFKQFLEGGELVTVNPHSDPVLEPLRVSREDSVSIGSDSDLSSVTSSTEHPGHEALRLQDPMDPSRDDAVQDLGGVWQYRQAVDNISLDDEDNDLTEDPTLGAPLPDSDMAMFDPVRAGSGQDPDSAGEYSNLWLLSALSELNADSASALSSDTGSQQGEVETAASGVSGKTDIDMGKAGSKGVKEKDGLGADTCSGDTPLETVSQSVAQQQQQKLPVLTSLPSLDLPEPPSDLPDGSTQSNSAPPSMDEFDPYKSFGNMRVSCGHGDAGFSLTSDVRPDSSTTPDSPSPPRPLTDSTQTPSASAQLTPVKDAKGRGKPSSIGSSPSKSPRKHQIMQVELGEKGKYIVAAARQISLAQQCEANGNYHMAFTYYKNCVGVLLTGVQGDDNSGRREVVRRKTARYLMKAEEIYNKHLVPKGTPDDNRWDSSINRDSMDEASTGQSPTQELTQELDPRVALLQGPVSEVANYRVLGIIDRVMLVLDKSTNATYVMKTLHKNLPRRPAPNLVPCNCPYVVRLHRFYETETALYLLLQHATGGKLWTYVSGFLNQQQEQLNDDVFPEDEQHDRPGNIYSGQYLHKSPTVKCLSSPVAETTSALYRPDLTSPTEASSSCITGSSDGSTTTGNSPLDDLSERGQGEGSSLADPDLTAPGETAQSYSELFTGTHQGNGDVSPTLPSTQPQDPIRSPAIDRLKLEEPEFRRDSELSLDDSHDSLNFHKVLSESKSKTVSGSSEDPAGVDVYYLAKEHREDSIEKFEELLKEAHRPSLENFSINSFDSDSAPGSRFDSTASDYNIESIPEVSETSPQHSDKLVVGPSPTSEEVFLIAGEQSSELVNQSEVNKLASAKARSGKSRMKPLLIFSSALSVDEGDIRADFDKDLRAASTPVKMDVLDSPSEAIVKTQRDPILGLEVAAKAPDTVSTGSLDEPSIYDLNKANSDSDAISITTTISIEKEGEEKGLRNPHLPDPRSPTEEQRDVSEPATNGLTNISKEPDNSGSKTSSNNKTKSSPINTSPVKDNNTQSPTRVTSPTQRRPLLRHISGERSLETNSGRRSRKRTLSGVFGELDLADEGEKEKIHLPEGCVRQWAAEMVTAIAALHKLGIVCRDLRPDNILLGDRGHILLTYFSQWNCIPGSVEPAATAGLYSAPEVNSVFDVTPACDWWSVGVLLFELLTGKSLVSCYPGGITSHTTLVIPDHVSPEAQSLLYDLLRFNPTERLGSGINGADDIRHHPFFAAITWSNLKG